MEDFPHHADFPDELSRPYSPHDEAETLDFSHPDETQLTQDCGYNSSASSTHPSSGDLQDADYEDDELRSLKSRTSSRSSVSSLPGSVFTHSMEARKTIARDAPDSAIFWDDRYSTKGQARVEPGLKSLQALRQRESAFRKPSSVRALQMHTEDEGDDEYLTPPRRRGGHRMSDISMRSSNSSPLKRSPYYSPGSASKQKVKKEYPLVLLHCTLLPPSLPIPGLVGPPDPKVLKEVLPSEYWRRWKLLEEKVGSGVLRDRGVLISHPEDNYDLLEDRLLESLELQHPRLDHGHFVGHEEGDSEEDQAGKEESETDGEQGEDCPDCGERFLPNNLSRKWEIKVFAANGLMRAGAWAAAWKEMEKVDVEVGLWLPSELRRELEKRLLDSEMSTALTRIELPQLVEPMKELESQPTLPQPSPSLSTVMPVLFTPERTSSPVPPPSPMPAPRQHLPTQNPDPVYPPKEPVEIDLHTLLLNYIRVLASDRRNVAIVLLSVLVVFFAIDYRPREANLRPFPHDVLSSSSVPSMHASPAYSSAEQAPTNLEMQAPIASTSAPTIPSASCQLPSVDSVSTAASTTTQAEKPAEARETTEASYAAIELPQQQPSSSQDIEIPLQGKSEHAEGLDTNESAPAPVVPAEKQIDLKLNEQVEQESESDERASSQAVAAGADEVSLKSDRTPEALAPELGDISTDLQQASLGIQKHELADIADAPITSSLEGGDTTFNDTPLESGNEISKIHDKASTEALESEKSLIQTQTAAKEKQALISMT